MTDLYTNSITKIGTIDIKKILKTDSKIMLLGSCFSTNLHNYLSSIYLDSNQGPFGNIYNPISIGASLDRLISNRGIERGEVFKVDGLFQHFDYYSKLGMDNKDDFMNKINSSIEDNHNYLRDCNLLVITLGTAFVYQKSDIVVNNCHKLPSSEFIRRQLNVDEIVEKLGDSFDALKKLNPNIEIVLTLSPVRHLRDSFTENSLSKAILRVAIDELKRRYNLDYFPSYEILLDELRDYRWYNNDLTHPSQVAVDYIMDHFIQSAGDNRMLNYVNDIEKINRMVKHRIVNPLSESSRKFIKTREDKIEKIIEKYPEVIGLKSIR